MDLADVFPSFASPVDPDDRTDEFLELISTAAGRVTLILFLQKHRDVLCSRANGLVELLEQWLDAETADMRTVWDLSFGYAQRAVDQSDIDATFVAASVALQIATVRESAAWDVLLTPAARLICGKYLLPAAIRISVEAIEHRNYVSLNTPGKKPFLAPIDALSTDHFGGVERFVRIGRNGIALLPRTAVHERLVDDSLNAGMTPVASVDELAAAQLRSALAFLVEHAPTYHTWVERVITRIVVCEQQDGLSRSASWPDIPGCIYLTTSPDAFTLAEALVHEASHQYLHLINRTSSLDDGSDQRLYYSPSVDAYRPLNRILTAYHAFANVLLFQHLCRRNGFSSGDFGNAEERTQQFVRRLDAPLNGNQALSTAGRALYENLRTRVESTTTWRQSSTHS